MPLAQNQSPGVALAQAITQAERCSRAGDHAGAADWLMGALELRYETHDDTVWRARVARLPAGEVPGPLKAPRAVEEARAALAQGEAGSALSLARGVEAQSEAPPLTRARAELLVALADPAEVDPGEEGLALAVARVRKRPLPGLLGADLKERLAMLEAAIHQRHGRYKEAIELYLSVPMSSGRYRAARLGLAWCQLRIRQPERALKILALLPGGLSGDPERALLAAMAAHALGQIEGAQAIVSDALSQRVDLESETIDVAGVIEAVVSGRIKPLLRGPRDDLTVMVASQGDVLSLVRSLQIYGSKPPAPGECALADANRALLEERVASETDSQLARLRQAWSDLERIAPQIR